jgi:HSP20 family protein
MAIIRWQTEPGAFSEMDRLRREVNRLFSDFGETGERFFSRAYPAVNLSEDTENLYVRAELPGVKAEDLDVTVVEGRLVIRGARTIAKEQEGANYHRREREGGTFRRTMALPERVDPGRVSAALKDGVLTVTLPKAEEAKPRKISVKRS